MENTSTLLYWVLGLTTLLAAGILGRAATSADYSTLLRIFLLPACVIVAVSSWFCLQHVWLGRIPNEVMGLFGFEKNQMWFQLFYLFMFVGIAVGWRPLCYALGNHTR